MIVLHIRTTSEISELRNKMTIFIAIDILLVITFWLIRLYDFLRTEYLIVKQIGLVYFGSHFVRLQNL